MQGTISRPPVTAREPSFDKKVKTTLDVCERSEAYRRTKVVLHVDYKQGGAKVCRDGAGGHVRLLGLNSLHKASDAQSKEARASYLLIYFQELTLQPSFQYNYASTEKPWLIVA